MPAVTTTILVPTDFSEPGHRALAYAVDLAQSFGAKIVLLHTYELPIVSLPDGVMIATAEMATRIVNAAQKAMDDVMAEHRGGPVEIVPRLEQGDARRVILDVAADTGAGLIVMGTHGRSGIARALIGSVTERIVRTSPVPVLTIHAVFPASAARPTGTPEEVARATRVT